MCLQFILVASIGPLLGASHLLPFVARYTGVAIGVVQTVTAKQTQGR